MLWEGPREAGPLFWAKKKQSTEGRKGSRASKTTPPPPPSPSLRSGSATDFGSYFGILSVLGTKSK